MRGVVFALCGLVLALHAQAACPFSGVEPSETDPTIGCPHTLKPAVHPERTYQNCTCKTQCGASVDISGARCDWCRTEGNCGKFSLAGRYDNCDYVPDVSYEEQDWASKMNYLWKNVNADHKSGSYPNVAGIFISSVQTSFNANRDEMPEGRKKFIHSVGAVCRFNMTIEKSSPYSGLFEANEQTHGLIRLGPALPVDLESGLVPGVGVKFLRSGVESGNYVALNKLEAMDGKEYNFFAKSLSNHIPMAVDTAGKVLVKKFQQASNCATLVGLSDICTYNTNGAKTSNPKFPFQLQMVPGTSMPSKAQDLGTVMKNVIRAIPAGTTVYTINARSAPGAASKLLGKMVTVGDCVTSAYGDAKLFFQHQRIEEDWQVHKSWIPSDPQAVCGYTKVGVEPPAICKAA